MLNGLHLNKVDLGVLLSSDLSWTPHITSVCSKAKQILGLLYRRFYNHTEGATLKQLYLSLIRPHLEYACPVWDPHTMKDEVLLEDAQKFAFWMATKQLMGLGISGTPWHYEWLVPSLADRMQTSAQTCLALQDCSWYVLLPLRYSLSSY